MWRVGKNLPSSTAARKSHQTDHNFFMSTTQLTKGTKTGKTQSPINWTTPNTSGEDKHTSQCSSTADDATEISEAGNPSSHQQSTQQNPNNGLDKGKRVCKTINTNTQN